MVPGSSICKENHDDDDDDNIEISSLSSELSEIFASTELNLVDDFQCNILNKLRTWSIQENINQMSLKKLLLILKNDAKLNFLPNDPRTLLKSKRKIEVKPMPPGEYFYFGVEDTLNKFFNSYDLEPPQIVEISINIDGLPTSKSGVKAFWPILGQVISIQAPLDVHIFALYFGPEKPKNINDFLNDFVKECIKLSCQGIKINKKIYNFRIKMLICDSPAKSFTLGIKGHCGYFSCSKCCQEGSLVHSIVGFPELCFTLRTDYDFR